MKTSLVLLMVAVLVLCFAATQVLADKCEGKEKETKVTIDQLPAAVAQTLQDQAAGGTIDEIEMEEENGVVTYEADITKADGKYECKVGADGGLISMKPENDDEQEDDD